ncbi:ubiquinol-cytochrome C chaperone family protein [Methylopila sp. M107]|uniref:ubiquinol-cytochrome C chaperone family protein n=1 Tax=Methylopila sp. M107 TaxID=1101190 RepID=UPI000371BC49|nr:ubiquinol-cytochrome C chaperone family protein [Methylopila sp. M107]
MFAALLNRRVRGQDVRGEKLYGAIVAAARRRALYRELGAPDTLPGRYELIVLHAALTLRRLRREDGPETDALGQAIFDAMFRALDANLREIGVGDLSVPKRIKQLARSFYDGAKAYDAALDSGDETLLADTIARIVLNGAAREGALGLAAYAIRSDRALEAQTLDRLVADGPAFATIGEGSS